MKKLFLYFLALQTCSLAYAEKSKEKKVKEFFSASDKFVNIRIQQAPLLPFALVSDNALVNLETLFNPFASLNIGPTFVYFKEALSSKKMRSTNLGVRIDLALGKLFPLGDEPIPDTGFSTGFYLSNAIYFGSYSLDAPTYSGTGTHLAAGLMFGYQIFADSGLNFDFGLGYVRTKVLDESLHATVADAVVSKSDGQDLPWFDLGIGYAF